MRTYRKSYWKTILLWLGMVALMAYLLGSQQPALPTPFAEIEMVALTLVALISLGVVLSGLLCLYRDDRQQAGKPDLFYVWTRPSARLDGYRIFYRGLLGRKLRAGDVVRVRDEAEILGTLDDDGKLDGLPFMPEMRRYCGRILRVDRRVDKINDMITKTGLRRFERTVTLRDVRCDGDAHGGCQAACQILWKEAWLKRADLSAVRAQAVTPDAAGETSGLAGTLAANSRQHTSDARGDVEALYCCQITELLRASRPMKAWDIRQDLRAVWFGNVRLRAFAVAVLTHLFNLVQGLRGGVGYPWCPAGTGTLTPRADLDLRPGERVRIKSTAAIVQTLNRDSRNRGMWFDREMLRFSGQEFAVCGRVDRLIDERSGRMLEMKTPCIKLVGVTATGEFLRFCPQNEYIFWREVWLERVDPPTGNRTVSA